MTDADLRALDAEIITKVFGYTLLPADPWNPDGPLGFGDRWVSPITHPHPLLTRYESDTAKHTSRTCLPCLPRFSADIAAAWLVAEFQDNELVFHTYLARYRGGVYGPWWCEIHVLKGPASFHRPICVERAETAPVAICRAALAAVSAAKK